MAGITIETRGVGRRGSATRSGIRANLASCGPLHHRFDALHCRDTGAAQPRGRARPASTLLQMIDRSNSEKTRASGTWLVRRCGRIEGLPMQIEIASCSIELLEEADQVTQRSAAAVN
jgi:hypothetical protein